MLRRLGCIGCVALLLGGGLAIFLGRADWAALEGLNQRQRAVRVLEQCKGIEVERLARRGSLGDQRCGYSSRGLTPGPVKMEFLVRGVSLALGEYYHPGASPADFYPAFAIVVYDQQGQDCILFSPKQCAMEAVIRGCARGYFLIPQSLSRHIQASIQ
jgi:hypothetical protein